MADTVQNTSYEDLAKHFPTDQSIGSQEEQDTFVSQYLADTHQVLDPDQTQVLKDKLFLPSPESL